MISRPVRPLTTPALPALSSRVAKTSIKHNPYVCNFGSFVRSGTLNFSSPFGMLASSGYIRTRNAATFGSTNNARSYSMSFSNTSSQPIRDSLAQGNGYVLRCLSTAAEGEEDNVTKSEPSVLQYTASATHTPRHEVANLADDFRPWL